MMYPRKPEQKRAVQLPQLMGAGGGLGCVVGLIMVGIVVVFLVR
jgi:hypothetical protein